MVINDYYIGARGALGAQYFVNVFDVFRGQLAL